MKLLHEITDTTFDMDTAYQTLSVTFNLSNLLSNVLKMMAYSGLTLKTEYSSNISEFVNDPKNQKALIETYKDFIQGIYASDSLDSDYPETYEVLKVADAYTENLTLQTLVENAFNLTFSMFDVENLIYINKSALEAYYEFAKALYLQAENRQKRSMIRASGLQTIQALYEQMYSYPAFDTIPVNSNAYIDLAFMTYACKHYNAFLGVAYIPAGYLNENKSQLNFGNSRGLRVIPMFAYPATNTNITLYYDKETYEFTETEPAHGNFTAFTNIKAFDPEANPITSCSFSAGNGMEVGYIRGTYKDADDNTVSVATFNGNSMNMEAGFNIPIIMLNDEVQATTFDENYYQQMNTNNQYWHMADNSYLSAYYTSSMKIAQMGLDSEIMKNLINSNVLQIQQYQVIDVDTNPIQDMDPNPAYEDAYTTGGGIEITDEENNSNLFLNLMSNLDYKSVLNGEKSIFEVLTEFGLYIVSKLDPNQPITESEPLDDYKDTSSPLIYTPIPTSLLDVYILNSFDMSALGRQLFDPDVNEALRRVFNDPGQAIISLGFMPFAFNHMKTDEVMIGNYATGIKAYKPLYQYMELDYGACRFEKLDYLSIEPYAEYEIFIPYAGKFPILSSFFSGKTVRLRCIVDILTGDMLTSMYVGENSYSEEAYYNRNIQNIPVMTFAGNCMRKMPISSASGIGYLNAAAKIGYGAAVIGTSVSDRFGDIGTSLSSMAGQFTPATITPSIKTIGEMSGNNGYMGMIQPYIIGRRRGVPEHVNGNPIKSYNNIGHEVPVICCHGYTEMVNLQTQYTGVETFPQTPIPTNAEVTEINEALASGVILP